MGEETTPPPRGRVLALDVGEARIGIALSDPDRTVALPAGTLVVRGAPRDLKAVAALVREHDAIEVVVGHPLSLSGERGAAAHRAEEFAAGLRAVLEVPVHLQDERLTTVEAGRALRSAGASSREARHAVDQAAASLILSAYLERSRGEALEDPPGRH